MNNDGSRGGNSGCGEYQEPIAFGGGDQLRIDGAPHHHQRAGAALCDVIGEGAQAGIRVVVVDGGQHCRPSSDLGEERLQFRRTHGAREIAVGAFGGRLREQHRAAVSCHVSVTHEVHHVDRPVVQRVAHPEKPRRAERPGVVLETCREVFGSVYCAAAALSWTMISASGVLVGQVGWPGRRAAMSRSVKTLMRRRRGAAWTIPAIDCANARTTQCSS